MFPLGRWGSVWSAESNLCSEAFWACKYDFVANMDIATKLDNQIEQISKRTNVIAKRP